MLCEIQPSGNGELCERHKCVHQRNRYFVHEIKADCVLLLSHLYVQIVQSPIFMEIHFSLVACLTTVNILFVAQKKLQANKF